MQKKHLLLAVLVTAVWGLNFPVTKLGLARVDPLLLTALRFTLAALPGVFFIRRPQVAMGWIAAYGMIFGVAMWGLINFGISLGVPPGTASLLIQTSAFFTLGWGVLLFRETLKASQLVGALLAALGLACVLFGSPVGASRAGLLLVVLSAVAWSLGNVLIKLSRVKEVFAFVLWASLFAPLPLLLLAWLRGGVTPFVELPGQIGAGLLGSLAFQVYGATHLSYWGWNLLLREYPLSRVAPLSLLIPVFGILGSILLLGIWPSPAGWLASALIFSALLVGSTNGVSMLFRQKY
ncbi:EamA family transporter [Pseudomonas asplenii]|uniref:EamA family transporter n=1 Tax=Pseudomonas asplenii TaxID=53407 RepID=UPI0006B411E2|nr:EamA family transporter [Pseudomonas fuscovaginae]KPA97736.1 EamA-like transporter family [Pseudomonas fuscovaginae]